LTIQPWEVRAADDFDRFFAAMSKQRPDGLYVPGGSLTRANQKPIVGFALAQKRFLTPFSGSSANIR